METYRFVPQEFPDAALLLGGSTIPDARGETRRLSPTILIGKRAPASR